MEDATADRDCSSVVHTVVMSATLTSAKVHEKPLNTKLADTQFIDARHRSLIFPA